MQEIKNNLIKLFNRYKLFITPLFISDYYIKRDIKHIASKYKFSGSILDFGCGNKPHKHIFKDAASYKGIDFRESYVNKSAQISEPPDFYFDDKYLENFLIPIESDFFDHSVSFQVLEHHKNPDVMLKELSRVTRKGGYILLTTPFLEGVHGEPNDFQRLTRYGLEEKIKDYGKIIEVKEQGSLFSVISMMLNENLIRFAGKGRIHYLLALLIFPFFLAFSYFAIFADNIFKSRNIFLNYIILIKNGRE